MASVRVLLFSVLNLDRDRDRCAYLGASLVTLLSKSGVFCLIGGAYSSKYDTILWLGDIDRVFRFIVAIIVSSECYLSTLFASRAQCIHAYFQASAHHNLSEH